MFDCDGCDCRQPFTQQSMVGSEPVTETLWQCTDDEEPETCPRIAEAKAEEEAYE